MFVSRLFLNIAIGVVVFASALSKAQTPPTSTKPDVPDQYQRFFYQYSAIRTISPAVLSKVGLNDARIGRSFALIAGISQYPHLQPAYRNLSAAAEDVKKLADYLKNVELFDEIVVLQNEDITYDNLAFFLQGYFPARLQLDPNSRLLIAYSGHGFTRGRSSFLVTSSAVRLDDKNPDMYNSLNLYNLRNLVQYARQYTHSVLALLNTCNSGDFLNRPFGVNNLNIYDSSAYAITAGTEQQLAWSYPNVGTGSLFFEKMFAALDGRANVLYPNASIGLPNVITVDELYNYLVDQIGSTTSHKQTPQMGDLDENGSTGLFYFLDRKKLVSENLIAVWDENATPSILSSPSTPTSPNSSPQSLPTTGGNPVSSLGAAQEAVSVDAAQVSVASSLSDKPTTPSLARANAELDNTSSVSATTPSIVTTLNPPPKDWISPGQSSTTIGSTADPNYRSFTKSLSIDKRGAIADAIDGSSWPPGAVEGGTYVVGPDDADKTIEYLKAPDNFTLLFDSSIKDVKWVVHKLEFGKGATIDLSAPQTTIPPAPSGVDLLPQVIPSADGKDGGPGRDGTAGPNGVTLHLEIDNLVPHGNLWIRTDGAQGGPGGRGGNAQMGGGATCGILGASHADGGRGGRGGPGGKGGPGGSTSRVQLVVHSLLGGAQEQGMTHSVGPMCSRVCGRSVRPPDLIGDDGKILVYGEPGCGGLGGFGGAPGPGGDEGQKHSCALLHVLFSGHVSGGQLGVPGPRGSSGDIGQCTSSTE